MVEGEKLVRNVNNIALFFATYPHEEALPGVLKHLQMYWEPRMKKQIKTYVAEGGKGLHPLALEAINQWS